MPPFREVPLIVDRRLDGEALHELRDIGHGHSINIVDASYDIPRGARTIKFPGSSANALLGILRLIPIEGDVIIMERDEGDVKEDPWEKSVTAEASRSFEEAIAHANDEGMYIDMFWANRDGEEGFYAFANTEPASLFVRTIDDLPFACVSIVAGHSQRTH